MSSYGQSQKEVVSFKEILLGHLKKILEITRTEFRSGYNQKKVVNGVVEDIYVPDSRKQYIQSIESFSDILLPFFDEKMKGKYAGITKGNDVLVKGYNKLDEEAGDSEYNLFISKRLTLMRNLFQELSYLLNRIDYLKEAVYSDSGDDEVAIVDDDEDD